MGRAGVVGKDPRNNIPLSFMVTLVGIYTNYDNRFNPLLLLQPQLLPLHTNYQLYSFGVSVVSFLHPCQQCALVYDNAS